MTEKEKTLINNNDEWKMSYLKTYPYGRKKTIEISKAPIL